MRMVYETGKNSGRFGLISSLMIEDEKLFKKSDIRKEFKNANK